jgi:hypothetical protein
MTAESRSARFGRIFKFPPIETTFVRRALCPLLKSKYMISLKLSSNCRCLQDPPGLPVRNFWSLEEFGGVRPRRSSSTPQTASPPRTVNAARIFVGTSCFRCGPKSAQLRSTSGRARQIAGCEAESRHSASRRRRRSSSTREELRRSTHH